MEYDWTPAEDGRRAPDTMMTFRAEEDVFIWRLPIRLYSRQLVICGYKNGLLTLQVQPPQSSRASR